MARVSSHCLRERETLSWKVCLFFACMCYSILYIVILLYIYLYGYFIYLFLLKLPFRWRDALILLSVYLWAACTYFEWVWLWSSRKTAGRAVKNFQWWELVIMSVPIWPYFWSDFHCCVWNWTFFLCEADINVKLLKTCSEWDFISLGKLAQIMI